MTGEALGPDEVHLWWFDADAPAPGGEAVLEPAERAAAERLRRPEDRRRFLARRVARRRILARYVDAEPAALGFDTRCEHCGADHGRPRLQGGGPWFNASQAAGVGVLAVARRRVGVDAEAPERVGDAEPVAQRFFSPAERARLDASDPATFLAPWCAKEAYLKLRGLGLAAPLERLDTTGWGDAPVADPLGPGWFRLLRPSLAGGRVAVALAVDGDAPASVRVLRWPASVTPAPSSG